MRSSCGSYTYVSASLPHKMNKHQVEEILNYAIQQLKANDSILIDLNVSERAVMFHLGRYIREKTPSKFDVDCEYNRHLSNKKQLLYLKDLLHVKEEYEVLPDILIHRRNSDENNILVLEIKKYGGDINTDVRKLQAFKNEPYFYGFAVQVVIGGPGSDQNIDFEFV